MVEEKIYKVVIARPAKNRYYETVLTYICENFSFERAIEVDENILRTIGTLGNNPGRGRKEKYLEEAKEDFKFILCKETKHFEIKIIYYINEDEETVYITDFFTIKNVLM